MGICEPDRDNKEHQQSSETAAITSQDGTPRGGLDSVQTRRSGYPRESGEVALCLAGRYLAYDGPKPYEQGREMGVSVARVGAIRRSDGVDCPARQCPIPENPD